MTSFKAGGWMKAAALVGSSLAAVNVSAMGCAQGAYAMSPIAPPYATGRMPYGMPAGYGHATPMAYGYGAPMTAYGGYGQAPRMGGYRYAPLQAKNAEGAAPSAGEGEVNISQMRFQPAVIGVKAGETVTWRNGAGMPHTVSGRNDAGPMSGTLGSGQAFSHTFDEPGTFEYYCALHPGMTGKVIVQ